MRLRRGLRIMTAMSRLMGQPIRCDTHTGDALLGEGYAAHSRGWRDGALWAVVSVAQPESKWRT